MMALYSPVAAPIHLCFYVMLVLISFNETEVAAESTAFEVLDTNQTYTCNIPKYSK